MVRVSVWAKSTNDSSKFCQTDWPELPGGSCTVIRGSTVSDFPNADEVPFQVSSRLINFHDSSAGVHSDSRNVNNGRNDGNLLLSSG